MSKKTATNEDILELLQESMQMTSDGFIRLENEIGKSNTRIDSLTGEFGQLKDIVGGLKDEVGELRGEVGGLKSEVGGLSRRIDRLTQQYEELKEIVSKISGEQTAQGNDIKEILDRLFDIEKRLPSITERELVEMQDKLQGIVNWAIKSAKLNNVPLKLPK